MQILDHVGISVKDFKISRAFYQTVLAPLGIKPIMAFDFYVGYGREKPEFWISGVDTPMDFVSAEQARTITPIHLALKARSKSEVDEFHAAAIATGAKDHGKPGLRPEYHANYYGAFVIDPDGNNLEAVFHG